MISKDAFIKAVLANAAVVDSVIKSAMDTDDREKKAGLKFGADMMYMTLRNICNDLDIDVPGVNVPELCIDCGGEDGDHGNGCPADKLAALGKNW